MSTATIYEVKKETLNEIDLFAKIGQVKKMQEKYFVDYDIPTDDIERIEIYLEDKVEDVQDEDLFSIFSFND